MLDEIREDVKRAKENKTKPIYVKKESKKKRYLGYKIAFIFVLLGLLVFGVAIVTKRVTDWGAEHQIVSQRVLDFAVRLPFRIEKRKPVEVLSPLAKELLEPQDPLTPIEQKIVAKWGVKQGYIALAVFRCESGLRADAVNWETKDVGIAQIHWTKVNDSDTFQGWEKPVKEKFGYTLKDMFDEDKNLEVAYWIWDRSDGKEGNGEGNFKQWVAFTSGSFAGCIK